MCHACYTRILEFGANNIFEVVHPVRSIVDCALGDQTSNKNVQNENNSNDDDRDGNDDCYKCRQYIDVDKDILVELNSWQIQNPLHSFISCI